MLRFLRKYNKFILAVFGTLLLIVFLIPEAIQRLGNYSARGGTTWATYVTHAGKSTTATGWDLERAQQALRLFDKLGAEGSILTALGVKEPEHWFLLAQEARAAGLMGGPSEALSLLGSGEQDPRQLLMRLASEAQIPDSGRALEVLNEMLAINRLISLYAAAGKFSDIRLKRFASEEMLGVNGEYLLIRANAEAEGLPDPSIAEIQAQFDLYKDLEPGAGDYGFGYRLPDRVKLEWFGVTAANVRSSLERAGQPTSLDVRKHWLKNRAQFSRLPGGDAMDDDAAFNAVQARVRGDLLSQMTQQKLEEIKQYAEAELNKELRTLPRDGNYRQLPENWSDIRVRFTRLTETLQNEFNIDLPAYQARGDQWLTRSEVNALPEIGFTRTDRYGQPRRLADVVFAAKEFGRNDVAVIQKGVAGPPMTTTDGGFYFFRIIDVSPAHAPTSVDEVQEQVVRDLKLLAHQQQLADQIDTLRQRALTEGFEPIADEFSSFPQTARNVARVDYMAAMQFGQTGPTQIPGLSARPDANEEAVNEITEFGRNIVRQAIDRGLPIEDLPLNERLLAVNLPDALAVMIFRVTDVQPIFKEDYPFFASIAMNTLLSDEMEDAVNAFGLEALKARHQFVLARQEGEEDGEGGTDTTTDGETTNAGS